MARLAFYEPLKFEFFSIGFRILQQMQDNARAVRWRFRNVRFADRIGALAVR